MDVRLGFSHAFGTQLTMPPPPPPQWMFRLRSCSSFWVESVMVVVDLLLSWTGLIICMYIIIIMLMFRVVVLHSIYYVL